MNGPRPLTLPVALDLRALQEELVAGLCDIVRQELGAAFTPHLAQTKFVRDVCNVMKATLEKTMHMDACKASVFSNK